MLSEALDRVLTAAEREIVERHLAECPACTRCRGQFEEIRRAVRRLAAA
jgi:anti-sigma factor RsiW